MKLPSLTDKLMKRWNQGVLCPKHQEYLTKYTFDKYFKINEYIIVVWDTAKVDEGYLGLIWLRMIFDPLMSLSTPIVTSNKQNTLHLNLIVRIFLVHRFSCSSWSRTVSLDSEPQTPTLPPHRCWKCSEIAPEFKSISNNYWNLMQHYCFQLCTKF